MDRRSFGLEGRLVLGMRATWDFSHRSGIGCSWCKTEFKKETNLGCRFDCIIENMSSYGTPSGPVLLPALVLSKTACISSPVMEAALL